MKKVTIQLYPIRSFAGSLPVHHQAFSHILEWLDGLIEVCAYLHTSEAHLNSYNSMDWAIFMHCLNSYEKR